MCPELRKHIKLIVNMATREQIQKSARKLVGASWHHQGRTVEGGIDCIGEVIFVGIDSGLFTKEEVKQFDIPDYSRRATSFELLVKKLQEHMIEIPVSKAKEGDVLSFRLPSEKLTSHVGILVKGSREMMLIHALENKTVFEDPIRRWQSYVTHAFRYKDLED